MWDYEEALQKGIFRNKTGLVADLKESVGPEVTMILTSSTTLLYLHDSFVVFRLFVLFVCMILYV